MYDPKRCEKCKYSGLLSSKAQYSVCCMYILIEGHMRGCYDTPECDKFENRTKQRRARIDGGGFIYYED